jgi:hypothetical protein
VREWGSAEVPRSGQWLSPCLILGHHVLPRLQTQDPKLDVRFSTRPLKRIQSNQAMDTQRVNSSQPSHLSLPQKSSGQRQTCDLLVPWFVVALRKGAGCGRTGGPKGPRSGEKTYCTTSKVVRTSARHRPSLKYLSQVRPGWPPQPTSQPPWPADPPREATGTQMVAKQSTAISVSMPRPAHRAAGHARASTMRRQSGPFASREPVLERARAFPTTVLFMRCFIRFNT